MGPAEYSGNEKALQRKALQGMELKAATKDSFVRSRALGPNAGQFRISSSHENMSEYHRCRTDSNIEDQTTASDPVGHMNIVIGWALTLDWVGSRITRKASHPGVVKT